MHPHSRGRTRALVASIVLAVGAALAGVATAPTASAADPVTINLLGINDFHGRIDPAITVRWAYEIQHLRDQAVTPSTGSLLVGAGDLIGASLFNSAIADDQPTIDVMNEIGLDASSVGNHEFDKGWDDLKNRVLGGDPTDPTNASWDYLGANVYQKGTQTPVLPAYETYDEGGVTVGVIGAVTQETSSLVSPGGISTLDFGPVVPALNRVAAQLSDGNDANGEADVIVAVVHAGAVDGTKGYDQEVAQGGEFADMATNLSPQVNAVFQGHTHQTYVYDAPVAGADTATRPMLQTGSYGTNIGQVVLTVDPGTGQVQSYTAANNAVPTTGDNSTYIAQYPDVLTPIDNTVTAAKANGDAVGNTPVGSITADVTTAFTGGTYTNGTYTGGTRDDRASESTLGDLVANALRDGLPADMGHADLGITNPGGLRNELRFAGDTAGNPANTDGVVTYAEANNVLPFVNNIWTVDLKGSRPEAGARAAVAAGRRQPSVPQPRPVRQRPGDSRPEPARGPARHVGPNSTASRSTPTGPTRSARSRSWAPAATTSPRSPAARPTTPGLVDRDLWIDYLQSHPPSDPTSPARRSTSPGCRASSPAAQHVSFTLGKLDLTSQGSPANTSVNVYAKSPTSASRDAARHVPGHRRQRRGRPRRARPASRPTARCPWSPTRPMTTVGKTPTPSAITATAGPVTYGTTTSRST